MSMRETQIAEAKHRLRLLQTQYNLHPNVLKDFEGGKLTPEGTFNVSENGILYWPDDDLLDEVKSFENKYGALVYHAIKTNYVQLGTMYSFLYVSKNTEEWDMDMWDLEAGYAVAYVWNASDPEMSEFGSIGIAGRYGGLVRTA